MPKENNSLENNNSLTAIHWFRQDLRLSDNLALTQASTNSKVLPIYIMDQDNPRKIGKASKSWLHHSLQSLSKSLNGALSVYDGKPEEILFELCKKYNVKTVYSNIIYEPWALKRDSNLKSKLAEHDIELKGFNSSLLWGPKSVNKDDGTPYKVFTPFYKKGCLGTDEPRKPIRGPETTNYIKDEDSLSIEALNLLSKDYDNLQDNWEIGETGAQNRLKQFMIEGLHNYKEGRNLPAKPYVSRLSPYLHFGEISANQIWHEVRSIKKETDNNIENFCFELGWREFSYNLLYYNPDMSTKNMQARFDKFPWGSGADIQTMNGELLEAWKKGETGVPMVDAGMRELLQTGYIHNRSRMIVGSFLVKNLLLHWHYGEQWFWEKLVDANLANNSASWQWIAGCGADAAPYFRIFNPVTQGERFDPDGEYIRKYVPEIAKLPNKYIFNPWEAPENILQEAGIELGKTYPKPIVDLKESREKALAAFETLKN